MSLHDLLKERVLIYDGSKGVMLQRLGIRADEASEEWNLSHPEQVLQIHRSYIESGSDGHPNQYFSRKPGYARHTFFAGQSFGSEYRRR